MQFKRLVKESGICVSERCIDASKTAKRTDVAVAWVLYGKDPDV